MSAKCGSVSTDVSEILTDIVPSSATQSGRSSTGFVPNSAKFGPGWAELIDLTRFGPTLAAEQYLFWKPVAAAFDFRLSRGRALQAVLDSGVVHFVRKISGASDTERAQR